MRQKNTDRPNRPKRPQPWIILMAIHAPILHLGGEAEGWLLLEGF